ncbi:reverse transcriptase domain-containing protein [Tanacetum coccineum]
MNVDFHSPLTEENDNHLEKALQRYGVTHKLSTTYHPQSNGQTEVTNKAIKGILERSVGYNLKDWSEKLNDALLAFRTTYKTPTRLRGDKDFKVGDKVLLYNSRLKMYPGKLKSKWSGPNVVKTVYLYGAVEIIDKNDLTSKFGIRRIHAHDTAYLKNLTRTRYFLQGLAGKKSTTLVKYLQSGILADEINNGESTEQNIRGVSRSNSFISHF